MPFASPEDFLKGIVSSIQEYSLLSWRAITNLFSSPRYLADIYTQMDSIGFGSLPIIFLTGFFTGCVLALQSATSLKEFGAVSMTGNLVALSMVKELGPVLTGLMVSGRNASGIASELGSMKVTEQIDAMRALGTDPTRKLVTPRLYATATMLPALTAIADLIGMFGGFIVGYFIYALQPREYWTTTWKALDWHDVAEGLLKPFIFSFVISIVG